MNIPDDKFQNPEDLHDQFAPMIDALPEGVIVLPGALSGNLPAPVDLKRERGILVFLPLCPVIFGAWLKHYRSPNALLAFAALNAHFSIQNANPSTN
jgi:hypothetical protein